MNVPLFSPMADRVCFVIVSRTKSGAVLPVRENKSAISSDLFLDRVMGRNWKNRRSGQFQEVCLFEFIRWNASA